MICIVEIELDSGGSATREYECGSLVEALTMARIELAKYPDWFVTNAWWKGTWDSDWTRQVEDW